MARTTLDTAAAAHDLRLAAMLDAQARAREAWPAGRPRERTAVERTVLRGAATIMEKPAGG